MRLAQFARSSGAVGAAAAAAAGPGGAGAAAAGGSLYGVPEMEIGRSSSNLYDSNPATTSWPVGAKGGGPPTLTAASLAAATAAAGSAGGSGEHGVSPAPDNTNNSTSPTLGPTLTPARTRHRSNSASPAGGAGAEWTDSGGGGGGGMGAEAAAAAFAEEAELEALQIDKNDLKLVFGRPFARGKCSEVYQVTHAGKNRAAKVRTSVLQRCFVLAWLAACVLALGRGGGGLEAFTGLVGGCSLLSLEDKFSLCFRTAALVHIVSIRFLAWSRTSRNSRCVCC